MSLISCSYPLNIAIILESGRQISYADLQNEIAAFQSAFEQRGLVFCLCNNDYPSLLCYLAALPTHSVPLLLPGNIPAPQLQSLMAAYSPSYIFHNREDLRGRNYGKVTLAVEGYELLQCEQLVHYKISPSLALLLATSGSTGSPKLVRLSENNLRSNANSIVEYLNIDTAQCAITSLPMHYSYGLSVINSHLSAGASIVLTDRSLMDPEYWRLIQRHQVSSMAGVPYSYEMLLKLKLERLRIPSIKTMTQAGGRLSPEKIQQVYDACERLGIRFFTMYGQTEATARIAYLPTIDTARKSGSIGVPIPGGQMWIEDQDANKIVEPGVTGELVYAGHNVSLGYATTYHDLSLEDTNGGVLKTGDLAQFDDDGYFYIVGRISRFIKMYGIRISLDAVEAILAEAGIQGLALGSDDQMLICLVGANIVQPEDVRTLLSVTLTLNKTGIKVRAVDHVPRLENGKIDYQKLMSLDDGY